MGCDQGECAICHMRGYCQIPADRDDVICGVCLHSVIGAESGRIHLNIEETMKYDTGGEKCVFCDRTTTMYARITLCLQHFVHATRVVVP